RPRGWIPLGFRVMKAVVYDRYGQPEVLRFENVGQPVPKDDEVLVKIVAATVTRADCATREANRRSGPVIQAISHLIFGIRRPRRRVLGSELAGEVQAVGPAVETFSIGDQVCGSTGFRFGAWAEFACLQERGRLAC